MINKSTRSILHGLTNGTDVEQRPEEDDLGVYLPFPLKHRVKVNTELFLRPSWLWKKTNDRQMTTVCVARPTAPRLRQESNPTETQQRLESRCGSGIACGKRGRRKDEFEHVICQHKGTLNASVPLC